jgi:hypothetical protein
MKELQKGPEPTQIFIIDVTVDIITDIDALPDIVQS